MGHIAFSPGEAGQTERDEREAARREAFALIEAVQAGDQEARGAIDRLVGRADREGWRDIMRLGLHASAVGALTHRDPELPAIVERLRVSAEYDADVAMLAMALSWRSSQAVTGSDPVRSPQADADLAQASVLLESAPSTREAAGAHVSCAIGYTERRLWELAAEHYSAVLRISPSTTHPELHGLLSYNRAEIQLRWACALCEVGDRCDLEEHCRTGLVDVAAARKADMPPGWKREIEIMGLLLEAIAGRDVMVDAEGFLTDGGTSPEFVGHLHLALALNHRDQGKLVSATAECLAAADSIDGDLYQSEHDLALRIAVELESLRAGVPTAGLRYAERQAKLRWGDRLSALGTMRARLETERRSAEYDQLTRQAQHDALTGLANRRGLDRYLSTLRGRGFHSVAVLVADIDSFKVINDTFGHSVGDSVLARVAEIFRTAVRAGDLVARLGGDEFVVVLADSEAAVAQRRSDAIHTALGGADWNDIQMGARITVSMGLAIGAPSEIDALTARADSALYRAKTAGKNRTISA